MKTQQVLKLLGITRQTLYNYHKQGKLKVDAVLAKNHLIYNDDSVYALIGAKLCKNKKVIVSYARVSTQAQKSQLADQNKRIYESCLSRGLNLSKQYSDIKSGMSAEREEFKKLIAEVIRGNIELVVVENKDRLVRFGFEIIEQIFKFFGTKILVLNDLIENKSYEQELTEDLLAIVHYFSMKSYSHRRKLNKLRKEIERENI